MDHLRGLMGMWGTHALMPLSHWILWMPIGLLLSIFPINYPIPIFNLQHKIKERNDKNKNKKTKKDCIWNFISYLTTVSIYIYKKKTEINAQEPDVERETHG